MSEPTNEFSNAWSNSWQIPTYSAPVNVSGSSNPLGFSLDESNNMIGSAIANASAPIATPNQNDWLTMRAFLGGYDNAGNFQSGWGKDMWGGIQGLAGLYGAYKQMGFAEDANRMAQQNFALNKQSYNNQLADRQMLRAANNPNAISVDDYMAKYGVA